VFAHGLGFAVQMVATVMLARLLSPADFGLVTMVTTFSLLLANVGLIGFPEAVLQRDELDHFLASNLFWINLGVGLLLTLAFAASGSLLAHFYGDPRLANIATGISPMIFLSCVSVIHLSLLKRAMRFSAVSANDFISRLASVIISIVLGVAGWGYWALVLGLLAQPFTCSLGAWILCPWVPSIPRRTTGTRSMVRFAAHVYGSSVIDYCTHNMDYLLVGWKFGSGALGYYKKAYELFVLPANQLLSAFPVAISTLSSLKDNRGQYERYLLRGISVLAFVGMGVGACLTVLGTALVRMLLGPRWEETGRIFTIFGPGIGIMLIYRTQRMVHLSLGTTSRFFRWVLIEFTVTVLLFFLTLPWGGAGVAAAWTLSSWILVFPAFWYAGKPICLRITSIADVIWKYVVASLFAGCVSATVIGKIASLLSPSGSLAALQVLIGCLTFGALYLGAIVVLYGGYTPLREITDILRDMIPSRSSAEKWPEGEEAPPHEGEPRVILASSVASSS